MNYLVIMLEIKYNKKEEMFQKACELSFWIQPKMKAVRNHALPTLFNDSSCIKYKDTVLKINDL